MAEQLPQEIELQALFLDKRFQELCRHTRRQTTDPFRVLGISGNELVWSNMLAWLLNPRETHGLGEQFLRAFLTAAASQSGNRSSVTPLRVQCMDFSKTDVYREYVLPGGGLDRVDVLLRSETAKLLVFIENKVWSTEGDRQTNRYQAVADQMRRDGESLLLIYVAPPTAPRPQNPAFVRCDYSEILRLLRDLLATHDAWEPRAQQLVRDWMQTIEEAIGVSEKTQTMKELARRLWVSHYRELEALMAHRPNFWFDMEAGIKTAFKDWETFTTGNGSVRFWPRTPREWRYTRNNCADLYYNVFHYPDDRTGTQMLWLGLELKPESWQEPLVASRTRIRQWAQALHDQHANDLKRCQMGAEDSYWLVHWQTDYPLPDLRAVDTWPETIANVTAKIRAFQQVFSREQLEEIPGVLPAPRG